MNNNNRHPNPDSVVKEAVEEVEEPAVAVEEVAVEVKEEVVVEEEEGIIHLVLIEEAIMVEIYYPLNPKIGRN